MDLVLLGAAAIVLVALTVWLVWRPAEGAQDDVRTQEANRMLPPQGDQFEDQYTSATADLSAGGVAIAAAQAEPATPQVSDIQPESEARSPPSLAREDAPAAALPTRAPMAMLPEPSITTRLTQAKSISIGAAALLTVGGAVGGAWFYSRWQRARNRPISRLVRRFR